MVKAIDKMVKEDLKGSGSDREFNLLVAKVTRNGVLEGITDYLQQQQQDSPMWIKLIGLMKENKLDNVILNDHLNLLDSLRRIDSEQA